MSRIGVFVCHCGENIASVVDCERVAKTLADHPGVAYATDYQYMCSEPGQALIKKAADEQELTGVVVAACSPRMHEPTFRTACAEQGLNPFLCEMANIREHCSWVHQDREAATAKAIELVRLMVEKVKNNEELHPIRVPLTKRALVIGGGIGGIQAALDVANAGHEVVLVEREPSIGGHMLQLSETFPTLDCSQCILTPRMVEVARHPNIKLYTWSEVEEVDGYIGNFEITIRQKARSVDLEKCTGCGACMQKCPSRKIPSEFNQGLTVPDPENPKKRLGTRTAIYTPCPQAVPNKPVIDRQHCLKFQKGKCGVCAKVCPTGAIDYEQEDTLVTEKVGAIVVATGYQPWSIEKAAADYPYIGYGEYGYGVHPDIIDGLQFERLLSASGPTGGRVLRPSNGEEAKTVVFLSCVGSRDNEKGFTYCSKICCMYLAKHAMLYKHKVHDGQAFNFYMDVRAGGKTYDEFTRRTIEEDGCIYLRGRVSRIFPRGEKLVVQGADTLSNAQVEVEADLVVLATAIIPQPDAEALAQKLRIPYDKDRFFAEA
ncbi:MAG: 4Fe-4S binding protein, partial [Candidatus Brocadiia bacterium]